MKKLLTLFVSCLMLSFVGCSSSNSESFVYFPYTLNEWRGLNYEEVESDFRDCGFTNIILETKVNSFQPEGRVYSLSINSNEDNLYLKKFHSDAEVIITYYVQPTPPPTPEPIVYTTEAESLISLFEESAFDAKNHISDLEIQYLSDPGRVFISYNIENAWSEHDISFRAFTNYVRFVQGLLAYQVEGVTEVKISIRCPVMDSYGNESIAPVLAWNMTTESFQQYNWENLTLREGVFVQFLSDCQTFWIAPFIEDEVDWNKVILWNTFEPKE